MKRTLLFASLIFLASCEIYLFEGPNDGWDDRDQFVGSYKVEEYSNTTDRLFTYRIRIEKSCCNSDEVRITNFYGADLEVFGLVNANKITIPLQSVDGYEVEGTGRIANGKLTITFVARDLFAYPVFADFVDVEGWPY